MNKKVLALVIALLALGAGGYVFKHNVQPAPEQVLGAGGAPIFYSSANQATSSVSNAAWSSVLTANSGRRYVSLCNDSVVSNSAIYLAMGATTTISALGGYGIKVPSNTCYQMSDTNMFYGTIYAIASSATSTLLIVSNGN